MSNYPECVVITALITVTVMLVVFLSMAGA